MRLAPILIAFVALLATLAGLGCAGDTTVILVRHAEKGEGQDPDLTPAGQQRATALVDVVRRAGVTAIYVTPFQRTRQTAAPAAQAIDVTPTMIPIDTTPEVHAAALAASLREHHTGARVLVVGHSNTVPLILAQLGVTNPPAIPETQFDRVFIAILRRDEPTRLIEAKYGP